MESKQTCPLQFYLRNWIVGLIMRKTIRKSGKLQQRVVKLGPCSRAINSDKVLGVRKGYLRERPTKYCDILLYRFC